MQLKFQKYLQDTTLHQGGRADEQSFPYNKSRAHSNRYSEDNFSRATILRLTPRSLCIWHMRQSRVIRQSMLAQCSGVVVLTIRFFSPSAYQNSGWASVLVKTIVTYQSIQSTLTLAHQNPIKMWGATRLQTSLNMARSQHEQHGHKWTNILDLIDALVALTHNPDLFHLESVHMQRLERFDIVMYSKGCSAQTINTARQQLFSTRSKQLENIPPNQASLYRHVKRALLQESFYGNQAT